MNNLVENVTDLAWRHPTKLTLTLLATSISLFVATKYAFSKSIPILFSVSFIKFLI